MFRNFLVINAVLFIVAAFLGAELYGTLSRRMEVPTEPPVAAEKTATQDDEKRAPFVSPKSFDIIASANLFNPDRTSKKEEEKVIATPPPKNQPKLFGTILIGERKLAILEDPGTRERRTFGLNESVGGYLISEISENKVVLSWSGEEVTIQLREDKVVKPLPQRTVPQRAVKRGTAPRAAVDQSAAQRRRRRPRRTRTNVPPTPPAQQAPDSEER
jgi:type II secretory pathway component PulC